jgi:hypothetical protein
MKNRIKNILLFSSVFLVALFIAFVVLAPPIIHSTSKRLIHRLEETYGISIAYESMDVSLSQNLFIRNISIYKNESVVSIEEIHAQIQPLHFFLGLLPLGEVQIDSISYIRKDTGVSLHIPDFFINAGRYHFRSNKGSIELQVRGNLFDGNRAAGSIDIDHRIYLDPLTLSGTSRCQNVDLAVFANLFGPVWGARIPAGTMNWNYVTESAKKQSSPFSGILEINQAEIVWEKIAAGPVSPIHFHWAFSGENTRRNIQIAQGDAELNGIQFEIAANLQNVHGYLPEQASISLVLPETPFQSIISQLPENILGDLHRILMFGSIQGNIEFEIPLPNISETSFEYQFEPQNLFLHYIPDSINVFRLRGPFLHHINDDEVDFERVIRIGPMKEQNRDWLLQYSGLNEEEIELLYTRQAIPAALKSFQAREPPFTSFFKSAPLSGSRLPFCSTTRYFSIYASCCHHYRGWGFFPPPRSKLAINFYCS